STATASRTAPGIAPGSSPARSDAVEGRAPSARNRRLGAIALSAGLATLFVALIVAAATLCVVAGFGIELVVGVAIAMLGVAPVVLAGVSRRAGPTPAMAGARVG
ncbi:MAG: hypothetical protein AAGH64_12515, partial [Planctomycetota bacterium]